MADEEGATNTPWPQVDPDFTLQVLKQLKGNALPNGKVFFQSYTKWNAMNASQRNKSTAFFNSLAEPVRFAVSTRANALADEAGAVATQQAAVTSANDRARFMHAMVDPLNSVALTEANSPLDRSVLDVPDARGGAWDIIADNFNNYDLCQYQNATIVHENGVPLNPYVPLPGFETMATWTHRINPQDDSRPKRDGAWCEKMWKEIRGNASRIHTNFRKSGNQDAENSNTEWISFCDNYSDVYKYFKAVVSDGFLDNMGRALPEAQQRDTGAATIAGSTGQIRQRALSMTPGAENRRRQRQRRADMAAGQSPAPLAPGTPSTASPADLPTILNNALALQRRQGSLQFLASFAGTGAEAARIRAQALRELLALTYGAAGTGVQDAEEEVEEDEEEEYAQPDFN